jgi:hypothetical protein
MMDIFSSSSAGVVVRVVGLSSGLLPMFWFAHESGASGAVEHALSPLVLLGVLSSGWAPRACRTSSQWWPLASVTC